jgi:hypothetical protein
MRKFNEVYCNKCPNCGDFINKQKNARNVSNLTAIIAVKKLLLKEYAANPPKKPTRMQNCYREFLEMEKTCGFCRK